MLLQSRKRVPQNENARPRISRPGVSRIAGTVAFVFAADQWVWRLCADGEVSPGTGEAFEFVVAGVLVA